MIRRWLAAAVLAVGLAVAGWLGWRVWQDRAPPPTLAVQELPDQTASGPETVETVTVDTPGIVTAGTTPMAQRVATIGLLNKRNGRARDLTLKPGQMIRVGDIAVHLRACETTAPWEADRLTGAFVQVDARGTDATWRRVFSGWLYKERPNLNVVQHPVYDVWARSCTMSFPATGPDTESVRPAPAPSAKKSPAAASPVPSDQPVTPDSAPANNAL